MLREALDRARCRIGAHEGPWLPAGEDGCALVRTCVRCGKESRKVEHAWGEADYLQDGSCVTERACSRCGAAERGVEHGETRDEYLNPGECLQRAVCTRCGEPIGAATTEHAWGPFELNAERDAAVRVCTRCGAIDEKPREPGAA